MRILFIFILSILYNFSLHAQVSFTPQTFENGFKYPVAKFPSDKVIEEKLNVEIKDRIQDLEASDYCIGEYGYVQKGSHIEIHIFCTCIDLPESEHRYILLNLETGESVAHSNLFSEKEKDHAILYIQNRLSEHHSSNELCELKFKSLNPSISYSDVSIRLYKNGIEVRPNNSSECENVPLRLTWDDLKPYLRYNFI